MAQRCQLICEIASSHGGDLSVAKDLIQAAHDSGADWAKLQLYNADRLAKTDPQRDWLAKAQVTRPFLDACIHKAERVGIKLTASVFGLEEAKMAADAGLTTIKIGSGDSMRSDLAAYCAETFHEVWRSSGIAAIRDPWPNEVPFYTISQYPTPHLRGLALLRQCDKAGVWGWSDHSQGHTLSEYAILDGATYVERHFWHGISKREHQPWDSTASEFRALRDHAEACAWEGTDAWKEAQAKYVGRWAH